MANAQLTPYLLDRSLIDYTTALTHEALKLSSKESETWKRANLALDFFTSILDPSIDKEKHQLDIFLSYKEALNDPNFPKHSLKLPGVTSGLESSRSSTETRDAFALTPAQKVLTLPDTLDVIFSHVSTLTRSGRDVLYAASLTSTAFYNAAQLRLWRRPRDLDTMEQQVRFAFGVAISASFGESLGEHVRRLRIRWQKGGWNTRLIKTIVRSCPGVAELTLHWGDTEDGVDPVTQESVQALYDILGSLPNLKYLYLFKFCGTEDIEDLEIPEDAHVPFSKLKELQLYDFHWYWKPISEGLGSSLKSLDIGFGTFIKGGQLADLPSKVTALKTLRLSCSIEIQHIRYFTSTLPDLERIDITQFNDLGDVFVSELFSEFAKLEKLREVSVNLPIGSTQLELLTKSPSPLEDLCIKILKGNEIDTVKVLISLVKAKHQTLKSLFVSFEGNYMIAPTDDIVEGLSSCSQLQKILVDFDETKSTVSDAAVEKLLVNCPDLTLTEGLESLVKGREFYEKNYKLKFEYERDAEDEEWEENVLGN